MSNNDISNKLKAIADNFESKNYDVVIQQALLLIEKKLREVIKRDFTQLDSATQSKIHKHLSSLDKSIDDLTMGQIVGLLRATKFFDAWKQQFNKELRIFETIDLNKLVDLRNETAHGKRTTPFTREEAESIVSHQKLLFQTFGDSVSSEKAVVKLKSIWKELKFILVMVSIILSIYISIQPIGISSYFAKFMSSKIVPTQILPNSTSQENTTIQPKFCDSVTTIPREECETLVNLYHSAGGENWLDQEGWLNNNNPCKWSGVGCKNGNVTTLSLLKNQLSGTIPDFSRLKKLETLSLWGNQLSGAIPNLSQLRDLGWIDLSNNQLSGTIPDLSQLKNLKRFILPNNQLSRTIPNLSQLKKLEKLSLLNNRLSGMIPDLSQLQNLKYLYLSGNQLRGTIPDLLQLKNLEQLHLSNNKLRGKIPDLSRLENLEEIDISGNILCRDSKTQYPVIWQKQLNQYPFCTSNQ